MSMNWTQYLFSKLAEEAAEVTKEALKCQQQGPASQYKGRNAIMELRNEFLEVLAVIDMLEERKDVASALGVHHLNLVTGNDVTQDDDYFDITNGKALRVCYYAMFAYQAGNLTLTLEEFDMIKGKAQWYATAKAAPSIDAIPFSVRKGLGSYYSEQIIDPPVSEPMARSMAATLHVANTIGRVRDALAPVTVNLGGSLQECADQMKKALALNCQLIEAEWDPANKEDPQKTQNTDGTTVYSWTDRDKDVRVHIHVQAEYYRVIHTDRKTGRHVSTERGEYKTF